MTLWKNNNHGVGMARGMTMVAMVWGLVIATPLHAQEENESMMDDLSETLSTIADEVADSLTLDEDEFADDQFADDQAADDFNEFYEDEETAAYEDAMVEDELAMEEARRREGMVDEFSERAQQAFRDATRQISRELMLDERRLGEGDAYWVVRGGLQSDDDVNFNGGMGYLAHGLRFGSGFLRAELEVGYGEARVEKKRDAIVNQDYELRNRNLLVFVNGYFDVASRAINYVVPYVGIGLGYVHAESIRRVPQGALAQGVSSNEKRDFHALGYSALAGFSFLIGDYHHLDVGYRLVRTENEPDVESWHEARIGFSRSFVSDW